MADSVPPFFVSDGGDLSSFDTSERLAAFVEIYDLRGLELLDSQGRPLRATVEGARMTIWEDPGGVVQPERLEQLLREYFRRLPARARGYSDRADRSQSLNELVLLFQEFERRPDPRGIWNRTIARR